MSLKVGVGLESSIDYAEMVQVRGKPLYNPMISSALDIHII